MDGFVLCLVQRNNPTLVVWWLVFGVIMIIKTYIFSHFRISADISVLLILAIIKIWLYSYTAQMLSFGYAHWPWENCQENCFFNKIQDGRQITCYSWELELLHRFVPRKQLTLDICWLHFSVILTSHFYVVYIKKLVTMLYFSIIDVFWLLNLCGAGGGASFAPQANLVEIVFFLSAILCYGIYTCWQRTTKWRLSSWPQNNLISEP